MVACSAVSKKLEEKRLRREAEERRQGEIKRARRNRNLVTGVIALLVAALVVFLVLNERKTTEFVGVSQDEAGCNDIETHDLEGQDHIDEGTPVDYATTPPTSGPHYAQPSATGFFASPIEPERLVHNLEHGQIAFWYDPDAPDETINSLEAYVRDGAGALVASPYDQVPSGFEFTMTAWGASQSCVEVSREVLDNFRERFQGRGPEQLTPPFQADA